MDTPASAGEMFRPTRSEPFDMTAIAINFMPTGILPTKAMTRYAPPVPVQEIGRSC